MPSFKKFPMKTPTNCTEIPSNQTVNNFNSAYIEFIVETSIGAVLLAINLISTILLICIVSRREFRMSKYYSFILVTSCNNFVVVFAYIVAFLKVFVPHLFYHTFWCRISIILIHFYTYSVSFIFEAFAVVYCIAVIYPNLYLQLDSFYKSCYVLVYSLSLLFSLPLIPTFNVITTPYGYKICGFNNDYPQRATYTVVLALAIILPTLVLIITFYKVIKHVYFSNEIQSQVEQYITYNNKNIHQNENHTKEQNPAPSHTLATNTEYNINKENLAIKMSKFVYVRNFFLVNIVTLCVCWIPASVTQILMIQGFLGKNMFYRISYLLTLNYPAIHSIFILQQNKKVNKQLRKMFGLKTGHNVII